MRMNRVWWPLLPSLPVAYVLQWKGWPRGRAGSAAEAELLSQLAVLLMPKTAIGQHFRSFPPPEGFKVLKGTP